MFGEIPPRKASAFSFESSIISIPGVFCIKLLRNGLDLQQRVSSR